MSVVTLEALWMNLAVDPSDAHELPFVTALRPSVSVQASPQTLANGRQRVVRRAGRTTAMQVAVVVTREDLAWLNQHAGETVCVRDDVGTKFFGFYAEVPVDEDTLHRDRPAVGLTIHSLTYSEAV